MNRRLSPEQAMMPCESQPKAVSISFLAPGTAASGSLRACSGDNSQSSHLSHLLSVR